MKAHFQAFTMLTPVSYNIPVSVLTYAHESSQNIQSCCRYTRKQYCYLVSRAKYHGPKSIASLFVTFKHALHLSSHELLLDVTDAIESDPFVFRFVEIDFYLFPWNLKIMTS